MPLINCDISPQLKWSKDCFLVAATAASQVSQFKITDTKIYVSVVTLSIQNHVKLLKQLESSFKITINQNIYHSKRTNQAENRYLGFSVDPSFPGVNRLFVLSFKDENGQESYKQYYFKNIKKGISSIKRSGITLTNNSSIWFKFKQ